MVLVVVWQISDERFFAKGWVRTWNADTVPQETEFCVPAVCLLEPGSFLTALEQVKAGVGWRHIDVLLVALTGPFLLHDDRIHTALATAIGRVRCLTPADVLEATGTHCGFLRPQEEDAVCWLAAPHVHFRPRTLHTDESVVLWRPGPLPEAWRPESVGVRVLHPEGTDWMLEEVGVTWPHVRLVPVLVTWDVASHALLALGRRELAQPSARSSSRLAIKRSDVSAVYNSVLTGSFWQRHFSQTSLGWQLFSWLQIFYCNHRLHSDGNNIAKFKWQYGCHYKFGIHRSSDQITMAWRKVADADVFGPIEVRIFCSKLVEAEDYQCKSCFLQSTILEAKKSTSEGAIFQQGSYVYYLSGERDDDFLKSMKHFNPHDASVAITDANCHHNIFHISDCNFLPTKNVISSMPALLYGWMHQCKSWEEKCVLVVFMKPGRCIASYFKLQDGCSYYLKPAENKLSREGQNFPSLDECDLPYQLAFEREDQVGDIADSLVSKVQIPPTDVLVVSCTMDTTAVAAALTQQFPQARIHTAEREEASKMLAVGAVCTPHKFDLGLLYIAILLSLVLILCWIFDIKN